MLTHARLRKDGRSDLIPLVKSYRGGYSKRHRRGVEQGLFHAELLGTVTTCALELGVDMCVAVGGCTVVLLGHFVIALLCSVSLALSPAAAWML